MRSLILGVLIACLISACADGRDVGVGDNTVPDFTVVGKDRIGDRYSVTVILFGDDRTFDTRLGCYQAASVGEVLPEQVTYPEPDELARWRRWVALGPPTEPVAPPMGAPPMSYAIYRSRIDGYFDKLAAFEDVVYRVDAADRDYGSCR